MSISTNSTLTSLFNMLLTAACPYVGVGFSVTNLQRTSSVVTLTTALAHNFAAGTKIVVRGTGTTGLDGEFVVTGAPTTQTFTYTLAGTDVTSASCAAGASSMIGPGYRHFDDDENWERVVEALTPEQQAWFDVEMGAVTLSSNSIDSYPLKISSSLYFYTPKDQSTNTSVAWDFALSFYQALMNALEYPGKCTVALKGIEAIDTGGICEFAGSFEFPNV